MKKINLSKELLLNGLLIGVISIGLASCGGGGGGGSGSTSLSFGGSGPSTPISFSTYLYAGTDRPNEPIIIVYIDGQPVKLLASTEVSGLVVNSTAVNIPSSDISSNSLVWNPFYSDISGVMASATVCLNPSITNSCVVMPIGVISSNTSFPATGEAQGVFGLASENNSLDITTNLTTGNITTGYSYPTYLERQYGINSYTMSFYPLSNGYYSDVSSTTPIGYISFGVYNGNSSTLIPYALNGFGQPSVTGIFPSSTTSFTGYITFDTGTRYTYLSTEVFQTEIPNFSKSADEGACASYTNYGFSSSIVNGGYSITYSLQTNSGSFYSGTFTTEPSLSFCESGIPFTLIKGVTFDYSTIPVEFFGVSAMLGHTFTWVLGGYNGLAQYIGISP